MQSPPQTHSIPFQTKKKLFILQCTAKLFDLKFLLEKRVILYLFENKFNQVGTQIKIAQIL